MDMSSSGSSGGGRPPNSNIPPPSGHRGRSLWPGVTKSTSRGSPVMPTDSSSDPSEPHDLLSHHHQLAATNPVSNNNNTPHCPGLSSIDLERPNRLAELMSQPHAHPELQRKFSWNPEDASVNIFVKQTDPFTFHRHPVAQSTDSIRGKVPLTRGVHLWRVLWNPRERGTHAVVGVATLTAPLRCHGYHTLVGGNAESWGWDINRCRVQHNARVDGWRPYPMCWSGLHSAHKEESFHVPEEIHVVLDMDEGTLSFMVDGHFLGIAFRGLKGKALYPTVSAVWGHCEIKMQYLSGLDPEPLLLTQACRRAIRQHVKRVRGVDRIHELRKLPLPTCINDFLLFRDAL